MGRSRFLFIVEGASAEPRFIKKMFGTCFPNQDYETYTYSTNLHVLASRLEEDYPDFDNGDIDIRLVLRSYETSKSKLKVLSGEYTDIFMIFDFEPQTDSPHFETIKRMLSFFNDSSDQGKLFINYPMLESVRHLKRMPDDSFSELKVESGDYGTYKKIVGDSSYYRDIDKYDYGVFLSIASHHLKKLNRILNGKYEMPSKDAYFLLSHEALYTVQCECKDSYVWVVNTCILELIDYNPTLFFKKFSTNRDLFMV